jgi:hypothetical protein
MKYQVKTQLNVRSYMGQRETVDVRQVTAPTAERAVAMAHARIAKAEYYGSYDILKTEVQTV